MFADNIQPGRGEGACVRRDFVCVIIQVKMRRHFCVQRIDTNFSFSSLSLSLPLSLSFSLSFFIR